MLAVQRTDRSTMPQTFFHVPAMHSQADADAVLFELQDMPCISNADVDLAARQAWVDHTPMISPQDIATALEESGYPCTVVDKA
jgi:copper chaperone CopZ